MISAPSHVIARPDRRSSTPRPIRSRTAVSGYWIAAFAGNTAENDTDRLSQVSAFPRHDLPESCVRLAPSQIRGRRECRVLAATHGPPANKKQAAVTTGSANHPAFPARRFYSLYVISLGTGLSCPHHRASGHQRDLSPASGRQDHTISPSASASFVRMPEGIRVAVAAIASPLHVS